MSPSAQRPLISVVMPAYNAERYVGAAIESILAQTYTRFELLVLNNGSTDGSDAILESIASRDARVRLLASTHGSAARARNTIIAEACGDLIAFMDADDIALPERFATQIGWITQTGADICGSCAMQFDGAAKLQWFPESHDAIRHEMVFRCALLMSTVMMRADIAKAHPFDDNSAFEDYELWTRLALHHRLSNVPQVLVRYRAHANQTSKVRADLLRSEMIRIRGRYIGELFAEASTAEQAVLAQVVTKEPLPSLRDVERAGNWLAQLAETPDDFLRGTMARRWMKCCQKSARLGSEVFRLYEKIAPRFKLPAEDEKALRLELTHV